MQLPTLPSRGTLAVLVGGFFALGLVVYGASLNNEFVNWDDGLLIYENPAVMEVSPASIKRAFTTYDPELYIPLTLLSYQVDYVLGGGDPFPFHLTSLVLHTLNALLVAWLALLLFGRRGVALSLGLIFLLHPLHTEAVAWASGRKDVLAGFWFLASLIAYMYASERQDRKLYALSIVSFGLSLMAKVVTVTLPVILVLIDVWKKRGVNKSSIMDKIPYGLLAVLFGIIAIFGKTAVIEKSSVWDKVLMAFKSMSFYMQKTLVPTDLSVLYPYVGDISITTPAFYIPVIVVLAVFTLGLVLLKRAPLVMGGLLFFLITASPTFVNFAKGELDIYFASDRYAYLPSIGLLVAVTALVVFIADRFTLRNSEKIGAVFVACVLLAFSGMSYAQAKTWSNSEALFQNVIDRYPQSHVAHTNIGNVYRRKGDDQKAIEEFNAALALQPHSRTYANLGAVYRKLGQHSKAFEQYQKGLESNSGSKLVHLGLGLVYMETGQTEEAFASMRKAIELDPLYEEAYVNLGTLYDRLGRTEEAIGAYEKAIEANPFLPDAYYNLAVLHTKIGAYEQAIENYERAIDLNSRSIAARINLGLLYSQQGDREASIKQFRDILKVDSNNATARSALQQLGESI